MNDQRILNRIEAIIEACEDAKKILIPTDYEIAESVAYRRIFDLVKGEPNDKRRSNGLCFYGDK